MAKINNKISGKLEKRRMNPNSLKNLRPAKKGEIRNPKGRPPKEFSLTSVAKEQLDKPCPYDPTKTWIEYLVERWMANASANPTYFKELIERIEGKLGESVDLTTKGESLKPDYIELPRETIEEAIEGLKRDNAITISPN